MHPGATIPQNNRTPLPFRRTDIPTLSLNHPPTTNEWFPEQPAQLESHDCLYAYNVCQSDTWTPCRWRWYKSNLKPLELPILMHIEQFRSWVAGNLSRTTINKAICANRKQPSLDVQLPTEMCAVHSRPTVAMGSSSMYQLSVHLIVCVMDES